MAEESLLPGITSTTVPTSRLQVRVLNSGPEDGVPVRGQNVGQRAADHAVGADNEDVHPLEITSTLG